MNTLALPSARSFFRFGIRQKLLLILLVVLLTALTMSGWLALVQERNNVLHEINQRGTDISRFVAKSLSYSVVGYDYHTIQLLLNEITSARDIDYARVTNAKDKTMGESGRRSSNSSSMVLFSQDIELESKVIGKLELGLSTSSTIQRLEDQKYTLLKREAIIVIVIALFEFIALSFFIIRPVRLMSESLSKGTDENGRIISTIPVTSSDEFGHLAKSFNHLSEQLNSANVKLNSKIDLADKKLLETNFELRKQSEELRKMSDNFRVMSITDSLTNLYNRRHFEELMNSELDVSKRHGDTNSLIIFDIDHFKSINDTYGHPCGDSVLRDISNMLKVRMRKTDYLCRIGGEEFAVLCKRADKNNATMIAESIRKSIEETTFKFDNNEINITVSLGVSTAGPEDTYDNPDEVYQHADKAVYVSKMQGRNQVTHYNELDDKTA